MSSKLNILVVDDELLIRDVVQMMLEDHGHAVSAAADGTEAIRLCRSNAEQFAAVLLDFSMPGMNGFEVYVQLHSLIPTARFVVYSGLNPTPEVEALRVAGAIGFLPKPFQEEDLLRVLQLSPTASPT